MSEPAALRQLCESYCDLRWHLDPVEGSGAGLAAHDGRLGTFTDEHVRQYLAALHSLAGAVEALDLDALDDEIDRTALLSHVRVAEHRWRAERPHQRDPGLWVQQVLEGLYQLLVSRDRDPQSLAASACARLEAVPGVLADAQATLRDAPRALLEGARDAMNTGPALVRELVATCARHGGSSPRGEAAALSAEAAMDAFAAHLTGLLRTADPDLAIGVGREALEFRLRHQHALRESTEQLLRYAGTLIEATERRLTESARGFGPEPWPDLVARLRTEQEPGDVLVATFQDVVGRSRTHVQRLDLMRVPEGALEVLETPVFARAWVPVAGYLPPGPHSADRTGRLFVTVPRAGDGVAGNGRHAIAAAVAHEGFPGHHVQFLTAFAQERFVRRFLASPVAVEGWALYAEELMHETGFYRTPEERLLQLHALLWRAVRIPLDVGLHTGGLSFEAATRLLVNRVQASRGHAEAEVRRTCAMPGYPLAYAMGRREVLALRSAYRARVGSAYTHRAFHDAVLAYGGLAPSLVRWGMERDA
jgi:uncharacterized protein (DUF885 family)